MKEAFKRFITTGKIVDFLDYVKKKNGEKNGTKRRDNSQKQ